MGIRTKSLFHFTGKSETLKAILKGGAFWPRYSLEDISWLGASAKSMAVPMVCFCDIRLSKIQEHTEFYGRYGIALSQEWGVAQGINPVTYIGQNCSLQSDVIDILKLLADKTLKGPANCDSELNRKRALALMSSIKPLNGSMERNGATVSKDFYSESEWRYVPRPSTQILTNAQYRDNGERAKADAITREEHMLRFKLRDVRYLFVPVLSEVPPLVDFITGPEMGDLFSRNETQILASRVLSLDDIDADF